MVTTENFWETIKDMPEGVRKLIKQSNSYEKGQAVKRISNPTTLEEKKGLGRFNVYGNLGVENLFLLEELLDWTVQDLYDKDARLAIENNQPVIPMPKKILHEYGEGYAVGSGSDGGMRLEKTAETLMQTRPEITIPEKGFQTQNLLQDLDERERDDD